MGKDKLPFYTPLLLFTGLGHNLLQPSFTRYPSHTSLITLSKLWEERTQLYKKLVTHCQEMGTQVNELGASVYPPQETAQMKMSAKKMYCLGYEMHIEVRNLEGTPDGVFGTCKILENSLRNLQQGLDGDLINEMGTLSIIDAHSLLSTVLPVPVGFFSKSMHAGLLLDASKAAEAEDS
ncbi:hypothetical protein C4D60_Mb02t01010 [Musa balbisiana]|uniref:Cyclin-D1-binding protein 1-like C-terminal domain-containing protein n=1 Tax=Musa balbisiana TaxID=52838 RepID=A0A4S8I7C4_MUSBA|nr:hypothetical protein C4D60_Mb02t01010 [Musa balbisiana]